MKAAERDSDPNRGSALASASRLALASCVLLIAAAFLAPSAAADIVFGGGQGAGAGQTDNPSAIAVDNASGNVYVADRGNNRIAVFDAGGSFIRAFGWGVDTGAAALEVCTTASTCQAGLPGSGAGQLKGAAKIAVDNDPASPSHHDVYVYEESNNRVQKFDPAGAFLRAFGKGVNSGTSGNADVCTNAGPPTDVCGAGSQGGGAGQFGVRVQLALGPGGVVYVADSVESASDFDKRIQKFDPSGSFADQLTLEADTPGRTVALAVDSAGDFYVALDASGAVRKYDPAGTLLATINPSFNISAIALDPAGNLFVADSTGRAPTAVYEYDSVGAPVRTLYGNGTLKSEPISLAPYSDATGDLFLIERSFFTSPRRLAHIAFPPPGPVVLPTAAQVGASASFSEDDTEATAVDNLKAILNTRVNPEGKATTVHFQYVDDAHFQSEGGFASPHTVTTPESATVGSDFKAHEASFAIPCPGPGEPGCLAADTVYHFRAVATNADAPGGRNGPDSTFKTLPPVQLGASWSTEVSTDSATLHAELNPTGIPASAHFEYVEESVCEEDVEALGAGHCFDQAIQTAALDFGGGEEAETRATPIYPLQPNTAYRFRYLATNFFGTFTGPEATLVTYPPALAPKTDCPNQVFRTGVAATLPDCRAYELVSPLEKANGDILPLAGITQGGNGLFAPARLDQTTPQGDAITYSSSRAFGDAQSAPFSSQYISRRDPAAGWSTGSLNPPRQGVSLYGHLGKEVPFKAFSEDLCSGWLLQDADLALAPGAPPGVPNLYRRDNCGETGYELLTSTPPPGFSLATEPANSEYFPEIQGFSADGAVSVFNANAKLTEDASSGKNRQVYLASGGQLRLVSVLPKGTAATVDSAVGLRQGSVADFRVDSVYHAVSEDGSRVFWSTGASGLYLRINATQPQSEVKLGKCKEPEKACTIAVAEAPQTPFWMANPEATKALYTAGSASSNDLYEFDLASQTSTLIAAKAKGLLGASEDLSRIYLVSEEVLDAGAEVGKLNLYLREVGGFDFIATLSARDSIEIGVSSFAPRPFNRLSRVSPDGLHAAFMSTAPLTDYDNTDALNGEPDAEVYLYDASANGGEGELDCVSCNPSGARPVGRDLTLGAGVGLPHLWAAARIPGWEYSLHPSRVLAEDGSRLFFESFEGLVLRDTNGKADVYEWQRADSSKGCEEVGAELFVPASGGCLSLISSGHSPQDAEFIDASASGSDVFFTTLAGLLPHDPGLVDIYDARAGGGFPPPPGIPPACEGETCQSASEPPNDPTPASSAFRGPGSSAQRPPVRCAKGKVRRRGRCVAKKQRRAKRNRHRAGNKGREAR